MLKAADLKVFEALPPSTTCRRIDFNRAVVVPGFIPDTWFLVVSGEKPSASMTVELRPLIYVTQPEYWGIEVTGCQSSVSLPVMLPYSTFLDITHIRGKKGVEVIGAHKSEKITVP